MYKKIMVIGILVLAVSSGCQKDKPIQKEIEETKVPETVNFKEGSKQLLKPPGLKIPEHQTPTNE